LNPPLFIASESFYLFSDNELYHTFSVVITIHLGNPGLKHIKHGMYDYAIFVAYGRACVVAGLVRGYYREDTTA
jgi:hypothetical protein